MAEINIGQVTNYDLKNRTDYEVKKVKRLNFPGDNAEGVNTNYLWLFQQGTTEEIFKFGYNCEPIGASYPLFLEFKGVTNPIMIYVGPNDIYEFQQETFIDKNTVGSSEVNATIRLLNVAVPAGIKFVMDYANGIAQ